LVQLGVVGPSAIPIETARRGARWWAVGGVELAAHISDRTAIVGGHVETDDVVAGVGEEHRAIGTYGQARRLVDLDLVGGQKVARAVNSAV
jgi:hypothetical protein